LPEEEKFLALKMIAEHHQMVASFVSEQLREGELKGYKIAGVQPPAGL
jgi:hypothetical protein